MSIVPTSLGWSVDEQYLWQEASTFANFRSGSYSRNYTKINAIPAIIVFRNHPDVNRQPVALSTDPDAVKYTTTQGTPSLTITPYVINGHTWYYTAGGYGFNFSGTITTTLPIITDNMLPDTQETVEYLLNLASVSWGHAYTVEFNANGGVGNMPSQTIEIDTSTPLTLNSFTRSNYNFIGWATSPNGDVVYSDGETVLNIAEEDETITLYAVWRGTYNVVYNANGGTGTMQTQNIPVDVPTALSPNTFTRTDYRFAGWATSATGTVVYADKEVVENIAEEGETITLYAIWAELPMNILLQQNMSEKNKVNKDITTLFALTGALKENCSIIDPVIIFEIDPNRLVHCNYITIPKFKRSYFVNNIKIIRNRLVELSCHVDVLSSFKTELLQNVAIIERSENTWNLYLNDGSLKTYQNSEVFTYNFPAGFSGQSFVLALAGD